LVFWGKLDRASVLKMPIWKRNHWIDLTIKNLKALYGQKDSGSE